MILITGARGFVGHKLMESRDDVIAAPSLRNMSEDDIKRMVDESEADTIIHTAAMSDIGDCAADPEASHIANVEIPVLLAKAAKGRKLVCFSSDQVYSGLEEDGPYEEENVKPANIYAEHKLEMEKRVLDILPESVMLRAEWMFDDYPSRPNYYSQIMAAQGTVSFSSKQYRGITYLREVAENVDKVIKLPGGVYNFGSETKSSMYEITCRFVDEMGLDLKVEDAPSRHNLWMNCSRAAKFGVKFSEVYDGLIRCARDNSANNAF
ncbi:MAG: sugar nucleotide-binding protein [Lachnospiraceae bacterium]|nr:sugar nucleotide-binding protein [Lachnospiraceae bacterium]